MKIIVNKERRAEPNKMAVNLIFGSVANTD